MKLKISFDATPTAGHSLIMFTLSVISPGAGGLEVQSVDKIIVPANNTLGMGDFFLRPTLFLYTTAPFKMGAVELVSLGKMIAVFIESSACGNGCL